jgi:histidine ammonia-lyase
MELNGRPLSLEEIAAVAYGRGRVQLAASARPRVLASRKVVDDIVTRDAVVYGVNTGFGKLADMRIPRAEIGALQLNLVRSHACGIGLPLSDP